MDKVYRGLGYRYSSHDDDLASQSFFGFTRSALAAFDYFMRIAVLGLLAVSIVEVGIPWLRNQSLPMPLEMAQEYRATYLVVY